MVEEKEYFSISKHGDIHTLSDRIPFKLKELIVVNSASFLFLFFFFGIGIGIFISVLSLLFYIVFRFASWIYYTELKIDQQTGNIIRLKKILDRTHKTELICKTYNLNRFEYKALTRSGKTNYIMSYRTHKNHALLILKNKEDKERIKKYITEEISVYNG